MSNYIGITIGPIIKMMSMTASPVGLWGTSYFFSYTAKQLCQKLVEKDVPIENFLSPYFELNEEKKIKNRRNGVGLFHDRIIFIEPKNFKFSQVEEIIQSVKEEIGVNLYKSLGDVGQKFDKEKVKVYIREMLQIYAVEKECQSGNPLININDLLDAMELQMQYVPQENINYLLALLENKDKEKRNKAIKKSFLVNDFNSDFEKWPLTKGFDKKIQSIDDIALGGLKEPKMKKHQYYAVVQADGDNMGKILKSINVVSDGTNPIRLFSKCCFDYCCQATDVATEYGAVTIYAGGDDLLLLAPLENKKKETIFDLLQKLNNVFNESFEDYKKFKPSLSIGMTACYHKYPLYESFEKSINLLFRYAKNTKRKDDVKNALAFHFQKHAGQSFGMKIREINAEDGIYLKIIKILKEQWDSIDTQKNFLKSVEHSLYNKQVLFKIAIRKAINEHDDTLINNLFYNIFDSTIHTEVKIFKKYIDDIRVLMYDLCKENEQIELFEDILNKTSENDENVEKIIKCMNMLLRLLKFYSEPGLEEKNE
ncbi:MAG: type III-B CRISPR-associated protein Cas10/Cmr2 [Eubacterium sp.]